VKCVAVFVLGALAAASVLAQQVPPIDSSAIPVEQEPRHRLVFVNDFVRIIDAVLPPLYVSQNHTHAFDNVAVTIVSGLAGSQGQARVGFAGFSRGGYSHVITNPNTSPMRFIDVELRAGDRPLPPAGDFTDQPNHVMVLNNARVKIARVKLEAGRTLPDHQHAAGYVSVVVRGTEGPGTWRWHGAGEAATTLDAGKQPLEVVEVEPK
jgi:quercetin dioxygenase-like cupin family protein